MGNTPETQTDTDSGAGTVTGPAATIRRNRGQSLVEAFRLERIAQRPALRTELHDARQALRQGRAARLEAARPKAAAGPSAAPAAAVDIGKATNAAPALDADISGSIFAGFCAAVENAAVEKAAVEKAAVETTVMETSLVETATMATAGVDSRSVVAAPTDADTTPAVDPDPSATESNARGALPLSAIGFGPGMTLRLRQLGIQTVLELASSDPARLRSALGEISQLINVDLWIANARKVATGEASPPET